MALWYYTINNMNGMQHTKEQYMCDDSIQTKANKIIRLYNQYVSINAWSKRNIDKLSFIQISWMNNWMLGSTVWTRVK